MLQKIMARFPIAFTALAFVLSACSGGGGVMPAQSGNTAPSSEAQRFVTQASSATLSECVTNYGVTCGTDDKFTPTDGDTSTAGQGQTLPSVGGKYQLPCTPTMAQNEYHIHFYFGVIVNGVQYATPDAIGIDGFQTNETNGQTNSGKCFYNIHTHDASGLVHIETPYQLAYSSVIFYLGDLLRIWGQPITSNSFAGFTGPVTVFVAPPKGAPGTANFQYSGTASQWTADPHSIPLKTHETIWVEIGTVVTPPPVHFYTAH